VDNGGGKLGDPADNTDDYNCYLKKPASLVGAGPNTVFADPGFRNAKAHDFRLKADSPCRGKGADLGDPKNPKPDLGAFPTEKVH
jgi:hypothetical protein